MAVLLCFWGLLGGSVWGRSMTPADWAKACREKPVFTGAFTVGIVFVQFPDTKPIDTVACMERQTQGVEEYFRRYTYNTCWPTFIQLGQPYQAPHPRGYYLRYNPRSNRIGWTADDEGQKRYADLRSAAIRSVKRYGRTKPQVIAVAYASSYLPNEGLAEIPTIRKEYREAFYSETLFREMPDQIFLYRPACTWGEPLWPNSAVDLHAEGSPGTMIHELGHVLGAPDFYHKPEKRGGVAGGPITLSGGPTGPLYCRWKYCAVVPQNAYRMITSETTVTLVPRWKAELQKGDLLGVFIPTIHPNYLLHIEYEPGKAKPLSGGAEESSGSYEATQAVTGGAHLYYININQNDPYSGTPDLAYVYRPEDPFLKGKKGGFATFREGDAFSAESDPINRLPNLLPSGVTLTFGEQTLDGMQVTIRPPTTHLAGKALKQSLLPIVELEEEYTPLPGSIGVKMNVQFRGEPLLTERGFVYGPAPHPTLQRGKTWKLEGIGYNHARLIGGLRPGATYYVRAYAKSPLGTVYSKREHKVLIPKTADEIPPLLTDRFSNYAFNTLPSSAVRMALLRLTHYYRTPLNGTKAKKGAPDYTAIHSAPTSSRFPPTLTALEAIARQLHSDVATLRLTQSEFPETIEKDLIQYFNLPKKRGLREPPAIIALDNTANIHDHLPLILRALKQSQPVLLLRESNLISGANPLDACIIDGYRPTETGETELHITFAYGLDRHYKTKRHTGWHRPDILLDCVPKSILLFLNPLKPKR